MTLPGSSPGWLWCQVNQMGSESTLAGGRRKAENRSGGLVWVCPSPLNLFFKKSCCSVDAFLKVSFPRGNLNLSQEDSQNDMYGFHQSLGLKHTITRRDG